MPSRLVVGRDVPWVTAWSGEEHLGVHRCPSVGGRLAVDQAERPGEGRPLYSRNHLVRQRRSVAEMLCPMCGKPTRGADRVTLTGRRTTAGALRARGLGALLPPGLDDASRLLDAGAIAPLHRACAERSHRLCPHLAGLPEARPLAFPGSWIVLPLMIAARPTENDAHGLAVSVVSFLQLVGLG
ncbi:hypothetical protein ACO2Q0_10680 [Phenylobacterium sp. VNQ135]|uniref:hypothetical protein n=1 Tax=Phenylobacterium sp. VNQ135 TaxID=3400922 RepID=UPI003C04BE0D